MILLIMANKFKLDENLRLKEVTVQVAVGSQHIELVLPASPEAHPIENTREAIEATVRAFGRALQESPIEFPTDGN